VRLDLLLKTGGQSAMAIQGLAVLHCYPHPGCRPMGDIDLLVPEDRWRTVVDLLKTDGYRQTEARYPHLLSKGGLQLDLHTHVMNLDRIRSRRYLFPEDLTALWRHARPYSDTGSPYGLQLPDPLDNFIALAAHALKHSYSRAIWLIDLVLLLSIIEADGGGIPALMERARFWRQEKSLAYAGTLLASLFGRAASLAAAATQAAGGLSRMERHLLKMRGRGVVSGALAIALSACMIQRLRPRLAFVRETVMPSPEVMGQVFNASPDSLGPRHSLTRIRKAAAAGRGLLSDGIAYLRYR